ncbi:hypothetical protein HDU96_004089 [Phlyctochytrium bullatum]|nr:hypothetical protein HDU96_004089 [Phlyctochytrium bullatum]
MSEDVFCRQSPSATPLLVKSGEYIPVNYFTEPEQRTLALRLTGLMDEWSSPFFINQIGQVFVKLSKMGSKAEELLRTEMILDGATVFIVVSREEGRWPFRIDNFSDIKVEFWQKSKKENIDNLILQVRLEGIGISLISRDVKIDNQLPGALEPIFVYPTVLPKEGEELYHLMATLSKSKDTTYGVDYYNLFTILLQEISIDLDEDFLYALINFAKFDITGWESKDKNLFDTELSIPKSKLADGDIRMYFEKFLVQPMQFNISFQRTHSDSSEDARS